MNMSNSLSGYQAAAGAPAPRPNTDLEDHRDRLKSAINDAERLATRISQIVIRLRGNLPPTPESASKLNEVPTGVIAELRDAAVRLENMHRTIGELLELVETTV
jgi:hypothetical protein